MRLLLALVLSVSLSAQEASTSVIRDAEWWVNHGIARDACCYTPYGLAIAQAPPAITCHAPSQDGDSDLCVLTLMASELETLTPRILAHANGFVMEQEKPAAPTLTELQKKDLQIAVQAVELWQLKAQQATSEFEKAREALQKLVASVTPTGYQINERLELVPLPAPKDTP